MTPQKVFAGLLFAIAAAFHALAPAAEKLAEYRIGPGDGIRVVVFQNPDLTLETRVTENGTINFPLVGILRIGGLTIPEAESAIARAIREGGHIQLPQVNIQLLQIRGSQVSVLGAVNRAGRFPLETANTRVSEMIAIAGGISPAGADLVVLTGMRAGKPIRREIDLAAVLLDGKIADDEVVSGGDVIYVHRMPVFYIYGEAKQAGAYRVERGMTVRQALARGGGPTARGTERGLRLFRRSTGGSVAELMPGLDDPVRPDDVLYVGESLF